MDSGAEAGSAFDLGRDLLCTADAEGRFTSLNTTWEGVLGWSRAELMARPFIELVHPDDVEETLAASSRIGEVDHEIVAFENRYRTKEGGWRWLRWNARSDGTTWFAVAIDVTEDKAAEERVRGAISDERLLVYGQPIADLRSGRVVQEELLVRLIPESGVGVLGAADFLPAAERTGAITSIDRWMTTRGLELAAQGRKVQVNLSARSINDADLMEDLAERVEAIGVAARRVVFEITETTALANIGAARELSDRLGRLGCQIALDDFGTGFASLTHLRELPVQMIKIDISFIAGLRNNRLDRALVRGVAAMARELGLQTVAEGVEDATTYALLGDYEIDRVQGYLVGRPRPLELVPRGRQATPARQARVQANLRSAKRARTP